VSFVLPVLADFIWDSSVRVVANLRAGWPANILQIPGRGKRGLTYKVPRESLGTTQPHIQLVSEASFPGSKMAGTWNLLLTSPSVGVKNERSSTSHCPCTFMSCTGTFYFLKYFSCLMSSFLVNGPSGQQAMLTAAWTVAGCHLRFGGRNSS
jgi:hypothetical protein